MIFSEPTFALPLQSFENCKLQLFPDMLAISDAHKKSILRHNSETKQILYFPFVFMKVEDNLGESAKDRGKTIQIVETTEFRQRVVVVVFDSKNERDIWKAELSNKSAETKQNRMFGADLKEIRNRTNEMIPPFIHQCVSFIRDNPNEMFTHAPIQDVNLAIRSINNQVDVEGLTCSLANDLIKAFLRALPTPLLSPLDTFLNQTNHTEEGLQKITRSMHPEQRCLLDLIIEMLSTISQKPESQFSSRALARMYAPYLGFVKGGSVSSTIFDVVEILIVSHPQIFNNDELVSKETDAPLGLEKLKRSER
ncbi:Rho-GAP domain-containing protein [Entamoeba marina]